MDRYDRDDRWNKGNRRFIIIGSVLWPGVTLAVFTILMLLCTPTREEKNLQQDLASQVLRFRVLADSDSKEDQEEKQAVRDGVLDMLRPILAHSGSREESRQLLEENKEQIQKTAGRITGSKEVRVSLTKDWFPERIYGEYTFPEGEYDTLRIEIGKAEGHNWWCVLYPGLCFIDAVRPVITEEGKEKLENLLEEETYNFLLHPAETRIRLRWF